MRRKDDFVNIPVVCKDCKSQIGELSITEWESRLAKLLMKLKSCPYCSRPFSLRRDEVMWTAGGNGSQS